jgi:hypothetical protein
MLSKVSHVRQQQVPSWFKLSKYRNLGNLDLTGWVKHLSVRQFCMEVVGPPRTPPIYLTAYGFDQGHKILKALRVDPLSNAEALNEVSSLDGFLPQNIRYTLGVHTLRMSDLRDQLAEMDRSTRRILCGNLSREKSVEFYRNDRNWASREVDAYRNYGVTKQLLVVDPTLAQEVLVNQFRDWLSNQQSSKQPGQFEGKYYAPDIRGWIAMGLLPCMDLMLWAAEKRVHFSKRDITRAIRDDGLARESATTKTTIPLAHDFLNEGPRSVMLLRRLRVEAAAELAGIERAKTNRIRRLNNRK